MVAKPEKKPDDSTVKWDDGEYNVTGDEARKTTILGVTVVTIIVLVIGIIIGAVTWTKHESAKKEADTKKTSYQIMQDSKTVKPSDYITKDGAIMWTKDGIVKGGKLDKKWNKTKKVDVYLDPICPGCGAVDRLLNPYYSKYLKDGKIVLRIHPIAIRDLSSTDKYSTRAASAMLRSLDIAPDKTYDYITYLMSADIQPSEGDDYKPVTDKMLQKYAVAVGMPKDKVKSLTDGKYTKYLEAATDYTTTRRELWRQYATSFATPVVTVNGTQLSFDDTDQILPQFQKLVDGK